MKKIAVFAFAILGSVSAWAVNGPYVGVGLGYADAIFNHDSTVSTEVTYMGTLSDSSWTKTNDTASGFQGQFFAGYAYDINKFRLGGEVFFQGPKIRHSNIASDGDRDVYSFDYAYGINFVPGYYITDTSLLYLKIGAVRGAFELYDNEDYSVGANRIIDIFDKGYYSNGLNLGLGAEMYVTKNIGIKLEYLYTRYDEKKFSSGNYPGATTVINIRPKIRTIMLGVDYQFNWF